MLATTFPRYRAIWRVRNEMLPGLIGLAWLEHHLKASKLPETMYFHFVRSLLHLAKPGLPRKIYL